jgi:hypothetical protein
LDADSFARTYRATGPNTRVKTTLIWAEGMSADGSVATREGRTHYVAGDFLVSNAPDGEDPYAISREKLDSLYKFDEDST